MTLLIDLSHHGASLSTAWSLVHNLRLLNHLAPPIIEIYVATHRAGVVTIELNPDRLGEKL